MREANPNIRCTVNNCEYHYKDCDYCSLDKIEISTHEMNPTKCECTDCKSFVYKG